MTSIRAESARAFQTNVTEAFAVTLVAEALNARIWGASGVLVATGVNVSVGGTGVLVETGVLVSVFVAVMVTVGERVIVAVTVDVGVFVGVNVRVDVAVGVSVAVGVAEGIGVSVGVLDGVRLGSTAKVGNTTTSSCGWQAANNKKVRPMSMVQNVFETITASPYS